MRLLHNARSNDKIKVQIWGENSGDDGTGQRNSVRESVMNEIFCNLLEKDLVIEINTSSLRKWHEQTMPGRCWRRLCDGKRTAERSRAAGSDLQAEKENQRNTEVK